VASPRKEERTLAIKAEIGSSGVEGANVKKDEEVKKSKARQVPK